MAQVKHFLCHFFKGGVDIYILLILLVFFMRLKITSTPGPSDFLPLNQFLKCYPLSYPQILWTDLATALPPKSQQKARGSGTFSGDLIARPPRLPAPIPGS